MTRPSIVRADTIDLQDHHAPSASKHVTAQPAPSLAPHQAETLREVAQKTAVEEARSPRLSWTNGNENGDRDLHQYAEDLAAGVTKSINGNGAMQHKDEDDALAIAQNGGVSSSDEGDLDGDGDGDLDDDMMDKISSSPSIEDEEIDFEFVYALHTFVATVEGQANATKGDTMVLLDDSNSYWWLVRVVKDSSIGYLPAEHIETPTERLARLNKHRNVDLSATMLGDQAVKPRNPFIPGIRRKRKTVTFTDPTYVDYPEVDYSTEEEDIDELFGKQPVTAQQQIDQQKADEEQKQVQQQAQGQDAKQDSEQQDRQKAQQDPAAEDTKNDAIRVQPLATRPKKEVEISEPVREETAEELERDRAQENDELAIDSRLEAPSKSRNGNIRNTDSFFRDETVETKKITLTPNLLRDDNAPQNNDPINRDIKSRTSLDKMEKELMSDKDRKKSRDKEKREKEKKPSAIRSFFSRKDKKKSTDDDDESFGKRSMDTVSEPRESEDPMAVEQSPEKGQKNAGKLQKPQPRIEPSVIGKAPTLAGPKTATVDYARTNDVSNVPPASMRIVDPDTKETKEIPSNQQLPRDTNRDRSTSSSSRDDRPAISAKSPARAASAGLDKQPPRAMQAKTRMDLDMSSDEESDIFGPEKGAARPRAENGAAQVPPPQRPAPKPAVDEDVEKAMRPKLPGGFPDSYQSASTVSSDKTVTPLNVDTTTDRLSESPVEVSPVSPVVTKPPGLMVDMSSQEGISPEPSPSPELIHADEASKDGSSTTTSREEAWDDSKLRAFFDESDHVRDLLVVVYDKTNVAPVANDHPITGNLFREQNAKLAEITTQLDNMLGDWLARKQRLRGAV